jgi:hypothetical protein
MPHLTEEQFQQLADDTLASTEVEVIWRHLDNCESCLDHLSQWFEGHHISVDMKANRVEADTFRWKLMQRIQREEVTRTMLSFSYTGLVAIFGLVVKSILAIGAREMPPK